MSDTQLLRDIVSELKKINKKLDDLNTATAAVEGAVWDTAPS
ncbi:hypothetical protein [Homoserinimonas sp. A520]